ncbi:MAG: transporter [Bacteroidales bacterium]|nr:transporter [Bacteroidales bacterium]
MRIRHILVIAMAMIGVSAMAQTEELNVVFNRPGYANGTGVLSKKSLAFETGIGFGEDKSFMINTSTLRYGLLNRLEVLGTITFTKGDGMSDLGLGAEFQLLDEETSPISVSVQGRYVSDLGNSSRAGVFSLNLGRSINDVFSLTANYGYDVNKDWDNCHHAILNASFGINDKLGVFGEFIEDIVVKGDNYSNLNFGVNYMLNERMQVDCSYARHLDQYHSWDVEIGFAWLIK